MQVYLVATAMVFTLAASAASREADTQTIVAHESGRRIDAAVQRTTKGGFWGAILVAQKRKVLLAKGYGHRDYGTEPNTPSTLFEIASSSKPFTAAAILKLERQGKLKTSDSLSAFFPEIPADKHSVQVVHLLQHTSGPKTEGVPYDSRIARRDYIAHALKAPIARVPGEHFAYSNVGYAILAAIVEVVSGQSFERYCKESLFRPAGMVDTAFIQDKDLLARGGAATRLGAREQTMTAVDWHWGWGYRGMGGVVTTVTDLFRWDRALRSDAVLNEATRKKYYKPRLESYACGWQVDVTATVGREVGHTGSVRGFRCAFLRLLEDDVVIAVCTNDAADPRQVAKLAKNTLVPPRSIEATIDIGPLRHSQRSSCARSKVDRRARRRMDGHRAAVSQQPCATVRATARRCEYGRTSQAGARDSGPREG